MDNNLVDPDLSPTTRQANVNLDLIVTHPPVLLLGLPPVMQAEHDGEGAGGQHLLVVVVVQAVGCRQSKSVPNLSEPGKTAEFHRNNDFEI